MTIGRPLIDLTGLDFGRLTVIHRAPNADDKSVRWLCLCECGRTVEPRGGDLRSGDTKSCGCLLRETAAALGRAHAVATGRANKTHGHTINGHSRTYISWFLMKARCTNPNGNRWRHYGGRGIRVCDRWFNSFENFLADMGERPADRSIDRIDNDGNYEPANCRWATPTQQIHNR